MKLRKKSVVTGIEPTTPGLLDQRCSRSDNQAPRPRSKYDTKRILVLIQKIDLNEEMNDF